MRVCFLAPVWRRGVHIRGWVEELAQRGVECFTISDSDGNGLPSFNYLANPDDGLGHEKIHYALNNPADFIRGKLLGSDFAWRFHGHRIRKKLSDWGVSILHAHYVEPFAILARYVRFRPWVASAWGSDLAEVESDSRTARKVSRALLEADLVHVETQRQARILESIGLPRERLLVQNWGVRTDIFRPGPASLRLRAKLGIRRNDIVLLSLRAHEQNYSVDLILRALALLPKYRPSVRCVIASSGAETLNLENLARQLGIEDRVRFVGDLPHSNLPGYCRIADAYVQAPITDGVSYALLEAMSSGLPVITTGTGDTPENVHDGENGLFFPAGRADALAERITSLAKDRKARSRMGRRAREWVLKNCDRRASFDLFVSGYKELAKA